jgi:hypothetical protein
MPGAFCPFTTGCGGGGGGGGGGGDGTSPKGTTTSKKIGASKGATYLHWLTASAAARIHGSQSGTLELGTGMNWRWRPLTR